MQFKDAYHRVIVAVKTQKRIIALLVLIVLTVLSEQSMGAAVTPTVAPDSGTYALPQSVTITSPGNTISYTTNVTDLDNRASYTSYAGPIALPAGETYLSVFVTDGSGNHSVGSYKYNITDNSVPVVTSLPGQGMYVKKPLYVTLNLNKAGSMYYTTDGSVPNLSSTMYTEPLFINGDTTIKAIGKDTLDNVSSVYTLRYTFLPTID